MIIPDALRGGGYDFVVFDETSDLKQELWTEVVRSNYQHKSRLGRYSVAHQKGMNWFKGLYDLGKTDDPDWASYQYTTLEGGNVPRARYKPKGI